MSRSTFFWDIIREMKEAGCQFVRRNSSHEIFRSVDGLKTVPVPKKLDDRKLLKEIRKQAGIGNG